jgi:hypothetical protein
MANDENVNANVNIGAVDSAGPVLRTLLNEFS